MPTFQFKCQTCQTEFEFFKLRSDEKAECPKCEEKDKLEPIFTGNPHGGVIFKGPGFHVNDYPKRRR